MRRSIRLGVLLLLVTGCGPDDESTSATVSSSDDDCEPDSELVALLEAIEGFNVHASTVTIDVADVRGQLVTTFGLPDTASDEDIAAAMEQSFAMLSGPPVLHVGEVRCTGSLPAARAMLQLCAPDVDSSAVRFECSGDCSVETLAECPSLAATCLGEQPSCAGSCTGACTIVAAACDGVCRGTCSGTCDCVDGTGACAGRCEGSCDGTCELVGSTCEGTCLGACEAESTRSPCDGTILCADAGAYCTLDCVGEAVPEFAETCRIAAALAGAVAMSCPAPAATLEYAGATCEGFRATADVLENAAARLVRDREQIRAVSQAGLAADALLSQTVENESGCVSPEMINVALQVGHELSTLSSFATTITTLLAPLGV